MKSVRFSGSSTWRRKASPSSITATDGGGREGRLPTREEVHRTWRGGACSCYCCYRAATWKEGAWPLGLVGLGSSAPSKETRLKPIPPFARCNCRGAGLLGHGRHQAHRGRQQYRQQRQHQRSAHVPWSAASVPSGNPGAESRSGTSPARVCADSASSAQSKRSTRRLAMCSGES